MRRIALLVFLSVFVVFFVAKCPEDSSPDLKVLLQGEQVPAGLDLSPYCVDNLAWSVGSAIIGCESDLYAGDPVLGFLNASEEQIHDWIGGWANPHRTFLNNSNTLLLLNCEEPIHVRNWSDFNDDEAFQQQIFEAMKMRVDIFRSYFPDAIIALGPSIRGQSEGQYLPLILDRAEALQRAGDYGVFDSCSCFEPRVFIGYGPADGPNWLIWNLGMTQQALDVSSGLTNSFGLPMPLCVTSSFAIDINQYGPDAAEAAALQLAFILSYPNVRTVSWWNGFYDEAIVLDFLQDLEACMYTN